ncbi:MAG: response regulator, partial [Psychrobium sp.]|nr:response regulator [Psychrobium sp.]
MQNVLRIFLLLSALLGAVLLPANNAYSMPSSEELQRQLQNIEKLEDNNIALNKLLAISKDPDLSPIQRISVLSTMARRHHKASDISRAIVILEQALDIAVEHQLLEEQAKTFKMIGVMYYYKGIPKQAIKFYGKALQYYQTQNVPLLIANLHNNIGLVHAAMANGIAALKSYKAAEVLYFQSGTEKDQIDIRFNIAGLYNRMRRYDLAINMFLKVIAVRIKIDDREGLALVYGDIGIAYVNAKKYNQAKFYYEKSLVFHQAQDNKYQISAQFSNLSTVYHLLDKPHQSIKYAKKCIDYSLVSDNQYAHVECLHTLGKSQFQLNNFSSAKENIEMSSRIAIETNYIPAIIDNWNFLALILAAENNTKDAVTINKKFLMALEQQKNSELQETIGKYQALLESEHLEEKVRSLTKAQILRQLKIEKENQQQYFLMFGIALVILFSFLYYRRNVERRLKLNLSKEVKQRTQELEILLQDLQRATDIKSQFLANMSHEIRTPLTAVIGQVEAIIAGDIDPKDIKQEVQIIHNNSNHLLNLVNDILDLSRIEANKMALDVKSHDLHDVLDVLRDLFSGQAQAKGLNFSIVEQLPTPFLMSIDRMRLQQILINLCSNAIKFTHLGFVKLVIKVDGGKLNFCVVDSGIGLNDKHLKDVFNSFSQGDSSISRRFGGSGLGLSLSQELASMMDGEITVNSQIDNGSTFTLSIPCLSSEFGRGQPTVQTNNTKFEVPDVKLSGLVLLADDHQDNRRFIARLLRVLGLNVVCAENGLQAIRLCEANSPDLILLDIQMPEMDGIETLKTLRDKGITQPIIALTANVMSHEVEHYLSVGFDNYLSKPIAREQFIETISHYMKHNKVVDDKQANEPVPFDISDLAEDFRRSLYIEKLHITT